jgi:hypothetical protein
MAAQRASRDEWRRPVDRWKDSGLTAKEFAAKTGINAGTLQFWSYKLRRPAPRRFEVELGNGRRLRVPATFDASALKALFAILEAAT